MQGVVIVAALAIVGAENFLPQLISTGRKSSAQLGQKILPVGAKYFLPIQNTPCRYGLGFSTKKRFRNYECKHIYASNRHGFFCWVIFLVDIKFIGVENFLPQQTKLQ